MFDNSDFGYYKVNIERPDRCRAQFTQDAIDGLRFDKALREQMKWIYDEFGDSVYEKSTLMDNKKAILQWCEDNNLELNKAVQTKLFNPKLWQKHQNLNATAALLMQALGKKPSKDFNQFKIAVDTTLML